LNIYGLAPISGACHWYRIREPLRALAGIGHVTEWGELFDESIVRRHDTILTHMLHGTTESLGWQYLAEAGQHRLIYDIDDNIWAFEDGTPHHEYWTMSRILEVEHNLHLAHLVTTPSPVLATHLRQYNRNVVVLPNYIPEWVLSVPKTEPGTFTVGYQGAPQKIHQSDLDILGEELYWFMAKCSDARLKFYGQPQPLAGAGPFADRVEVVPWQPSVPDYYRSLHSMTVGIGPLRRSKFTECKSGIRAIEFGALGIPGVYSMSAPYDGTVVHRTTGYLVYPGRMTDWRRILINLYRKPDLVAKIGAQAREYAARHYTIEGNIWKWEQAYKMCGPDLESSPVLSLANAHRS
jgi:glycosyltransferase involved in cell wall biosynthesis